MTLELRPFAARDQSWLEGWIGQAARAMQCDEDALAGLCADPTRLRLVIIRDGISAGVLAARERAPARGAAIIDLVATPRVHARRGVAMAAVTLLEQRLRRHGARTIYAPVPEAHGIAVYFWIRLGYRPLMRGAWPEQRDRVVWMRRDPSAQKNGSQSRMA